MTLDSITLYDIGPFRALHANLEGSMVGITGRNGSGKSTILKSIAFALTGDTGCLGRKDAARLGRTGADQPHVVLNMTSHAGEPVAVCRWLPWEKKPGRHRMTVGDTSLSTTDEITRWIENELGLSTAAAREVLFVEQGHLTDIVSAPAARRADLFQRAFGLEAAARAYSAAVTHLSTLPAPPDRGSVDAARARVTDLAAQSAAIAAELFDTPPPDENALAAARLAVASHERRKVLQGVVDRLVVAIQVIEERTKAPRLKPVSDESIQRAVDVLTLASAYGRCKEDWLGLNASLDALSVQVSQAYAAVKDPGPAPKPAPRLERLRGIKDTLEYLSRWTTESDTCPVCNGSYVPSNEARAYAQQELTELEELEAAHRAYVDLHRKACLDHTRAVARVDQLNKQVADVKERLRAIPWVTDPGLGQQAAAKNVEHLRQKAAEFREREADRSRAEEELARRRAELNAVYAEMPPYVTGEEVAAARAFIAASDATGDRIRSLDARQSVVDAALAAARNELERAETTLAASDTIKQHRDDVTELLSVLHRDAAPAAAAATALSTLTRTVNDRLDQVCADYRVSVAADGEIVCHFDDKSPNRRAALLSPGQQMTLALAWRVALVDKYCPRAGVLCLDEPTTGLDETRILALRSTLDNWRAAGSGTQFVVVTHDRRLCSSFDRTIEL